MSGTNPTLMMNSPPSPASSVLEWFTFGIDLALLQQQDRRSAVEWAPWMRLIWLAVVLLVFFILYKASVSTQRKRTAEFREREQRKRTARRRRWVRAPAPPPGGPTLRSDIPSPAQLQALRARSTSSSSSSSPQFPAVLSANREQQTVRERLAEFSAMVKETADGYQNSSWWKGWIAFFVEATVALAGAIIAAETLLVMFYATWRVIIVRFILAIYVPIATVVKNWWELEKNNIIEWNLWLDLDALHNRIELFLARSPAPSDAEMIEFYNEAFQEWQDLMEDQSLGN